MITRFLRKSVSSGSPYPKRPWIQGYQQQKDLAFIAHILFCKALSKTVSPFVVRISLCSMPGRQLANWEQDEHKCIISTHARFFGKSCQVTQ